MIIGCYYSPVSVSKVSMSLCREAALTTDAEEGSLGLFEKICFLKITRIFFSRNQHLPIVFLTVPKYNKIEWRRKEDPGLPRFLVHTWLLQPVSSVSKGNFIMFWIVFFPLTQNLAQYLILNMFWISKSISLWIDCIPPQKR